MSQFASRPGVTGPDVLSLEAERETFSFKCR
jgi:hypothetical protein